jgi:competence protein ComEA
MRHLSLGQQSILFLVSLVLLAILYGKFYHSPRPTPKEEIYSEIAIEVVGEVHTPGIYLFRNPPTLKQVIDQAGGVKPPARRAGHPADLPVKGTSLQETPSLSDILETGTRVAISRELPSSLLSGQPNEENPDMIRITLGSMGASKLLVFSIPLDLNRASVEDFCLVPGIGESLARDIVTYRRSKGGFRSVEELKNVKGVGENNLKTFKIYFIVTPP